MPNLFRSCTGREWRASETLSLELPDGTTVEGVWAGSATEEKLDYWLRPAGNQLAQTEPVTAIATKADDDGELQWGDAPAAARLLFVVEGPQPGKPYRLAKMVTTAATPQQAAYFRHDRFSLFGQLRADGSIQRIPPVAPPPPVPRARQAELF